MASLLHALINIIVTVIAGLPGKTAHLRVIVRIIHAHPQLRHTHTVVKGKRNRLLRMRPSFRQRHIFLQYGRIRFDIVHPVCVQVVILRHRHLCGVQNFVALTERLRVPAFKGISRLLRDRQITVSGVVGHLLRPGTVASRCVLIIVCDGILVRCPLRVESLVVCVRLRNFCNHRVVRKFLVRVPAVKGITCPCDLLRRWQNQSLAVCIFPKSSLISYRSAVFLIVHLVNFRRPFRIDNFIRRHCRIEIVGIRAVGIGVPAFHRVVLPDRRAVYRFHNLTAAHHKPGIGMGQLLPFPRQITLEYALPSVKRHLMNPRRSLRRCLSRAGSGGKRIDPRLIDAMSGFKSIFPRPA